MKIIRLFIGILFVLLCANIYCFGVYLTNVPVVITQPDESNITIYSSGDEYYNRLHDINGYTIVQNEEGYYVYAQYNEKGDDIMASSYIVGKCNPQHIGLQPNITNRNKVMKNLLEMGVFDRREDNIRTGYNYPTIGTINNIVIYIRFADQAEFTDNQSKYTNLFNNSTSGANSVYNYFKEASYNLLTVNSSFYPSNNGTTVLSYQDIHIKNFYLPYSSANDSGYTQSNMHQREEDLLNRAVNAVRNDIPTSLNIDCNNDGYVDNICFIIREGDNVWGNLLWPHMSEITIPILFPQINNKYVYCYNLHTENYINPKGTGVLCHEFCHSLGAPDLYHYYDDNQNGIPIGPWDIMGTTRNPPQHTNVYIKCQLFHWIDNIPEITSSGTYTLNPIRSATNNCYKIPIKDVPNEFLVLEYRRTIGAFESSLPGSGLLIYRINTTNNISRGNKDGIGCCTSDDYFYLYRPNGSPTSNGTVNSAYFSSNSSRTIFSTKTNPYSLLSDTTIANVQIKNITSASSTISFDVVFCDGDNIVYNNTNNIPSITNAARTITTIGNVSITNPNSVKFEANESVLLGKGFTVELGSSLEVDMNGCFEQ